MFVYNYVHVGVILGNPNAEHVVISDTKLRCTINGTGMGGGG